MENLKKGKNNISNLTLPEVLSVKAVKELLTKHPIDVNTIFLQKYELSEMTTTFLHSAISQQNEELIDWLLTQKVNINLKLSLRGPPINVAIEKQDLKTVQKLVSLGADLNPHKSKDSYTPLGEACLYGRTKILKYLIENGADVNQLPFRGQHSRDDRSLLQTCVELDQIEMTEFILSKGAADINYKSSDGSTALIYAAESGNSELVKLLIDKGADINCVYKKKNDTLTVLHAAIYSCKPKAVKFFLNFDDSIFDINILTRKEKQPILQFVLEHLFDFYNLFDFLLTAGANVNVEDCNGELAIDLCQKPHWNYDNIIMDKTLNMHLVKLISANLPVCQRNKDKVGGKWGKYTAECREEVTQLKNTKISDINTTFYDVLHLSNHHLARRVRRLEIDYNLEENEEKLCKMFPLYGGMLAFKLAKAQRRVRRCIKAEEEIMKIFVRLGLPYDFCREMLRYLNDSDLKKIIGEKIYN